MAVDLFTMYLPLLMLIHFNNTIIYINIILILIYYITHIFFLISVPNIVIIASRYFRVNFNNDGYIIVKLYNMYVKYIWVLGTYILF